MIFHASEIVFDLKDIRSGEWFAHLTCYFNKLINSCFRVENFESESIFESFHFPGVAFSYHYAAHFIREKRCVLVFFNFTFGGFVDFYEVMIVES